MKETKIFFSPKKIPELILKEKNNKIGLTPKKIRKSMLLTESKTDEIDLNNILTLRKLNIKKRLKPNKTEFIYSFYGGNIRSFAQHDYCARFAKQAAPV